MQRSRVASSVAVLACALVIGCSDGADPAPQDPSTSETVPAPSPSASEEASPSPSATVADEPESEAAEPEAAESPSASEELDAAVASRSLAIEQRHPNGSILRVTSLQVEATSITVGIEVINGLGSEFSLAPGGGNAVRLSDDLGGVYEFLKPRENPDLRVEARGTLTGELVYFGLVNPEATTLRLQTNVPLYLDGPVYDPATEATDDRNPHFSVEIPLTP